MKKWFGAISAGLMLASCVPATPQYRIQKEPGKYDPLSEKHKELVQKGQITRGMPQDAVYLAWGRPSQAFQGSKNGRAAERWDYAGTQAVPTNGFYGAYGYGPYRYYNPYLYSGYGIGPEVAYVPYRIASVWFIENKVDSWERAR